MIADFFPKLRYSSKLRMPGLTTIQKKNCPFELFECPGNVYTLHSC